MVLHTGMRTRQFADQSIGISGLSRKYPHRRLLDDHAAWHFAILASRWPKGLPRPRALPLRSEPHKPWCDRQQKFP